MRWTSSHEGFGWLNQSWTSNWSHAAARRLREVAGRNSVRVSNSRLTVRGLGVMSAEPVSGYVASSGTLRPNRHPRLPIFGCSRSL